MEDKTMSEKMQMAVERFNKCVLLDPDGSAQQLFERHTEILTTHQSDLNVEFANKIING